jgi:hypothetical protein
MACRNAGFAAHIRKQTRCLDITAAHVPPPHYHGDMESCRNELRGDNQGETQRQSG